MKRIIGFICAMLMALFIASSGIYAHSINGVDSVTSGKKIEFGSASLVSGSVTVSHSLAGTPTAALLTLDYTGLGNGSATTLKAKISGTNSVTFYAYDGNTGNTSTQSFAGYYLLGK